MPKICQKDTQNISGFYHDMSIYAEDKSKLYPWYATNMPMTRTRYTHHMLKICSRYNKDTHKMCPRYALDMPKICSRYVTDMSLIRL